MSIGLLAATPGTRKRTWIVTLAKCGRPLFGEGRFLRKPQMMFTDRIRLGDRLRGVHGLRALSKLKAREKGMLRKLLK